MNVEKLRQTTEADIARWMKADGINEDDFGSPRVVVPKVDVQKLRERLGLSQEAFARRFFLPLRTIQEWEQHRREPSEPACVLLYAIDRNPGQLAKVLNGA